MKLERYQSDLADAFINFISTLAKQADQAESIEEVQDIVEEFRATAGNGLRSLDTFYATMLLNENEPWYNPEEGLKLIKETAEAGDINSQFCLGCLLLKGQKGIPEDKIMAKYWLNKAEEGGGFEIDL